MFPTMIEARTPTTNTAVTRIEKKYSIQFPQDYRAFLLATNGGKPRDSAFPIACGPRGDISNVKVFLGIGVKVTTSEIEYPLDLYAGSLPSEFVPIASQDNGDYLGLDLRADSVAVVYWDHRHFWSTGEWRERDLYHVADSFHEFLGLLTSLPT